MSEFNDGGPAFPVREADRFNPDNNETHTIEQHWGMSLRDYFAGQALAGMLSRQTTVDEWPTFTEFAKDAYRYANAMLKAREGGAQ